MVGEILMIIFSIVVVGLLANQYFNALKTHRFRQTTGMVLSSEIKGELGSSRYYFEPLIFYEYTVEGKRYENNIYSVAFTTHYKSKVKKILSRYKPGRTIDIYFNPKDPSESVLMTGIKPIRSFAMIIMVSLLLIAVIEIIFF